jgi:hypothetical protein
MVGKTKKNVFGINVRFTLMGGDRYTPIPEDITFEDVMKRPDKSIPEIDGVDPYTKQKGMNLGSAFSVKYTINKRHTSHHFILEYLQMKTFQGQTFDLRTHEIADKFTRNAIMTSNEIRQVIGMKPSDDPKADELNNSNLYSNPSAMPMEGEMPVEGESPMGAEVPVEEEIPADEPDDRDLSEILISEIMN